MADIGEIFGIPLGNGKIAIGQIFEKKAAGLALIAVFEQLFSETVKPALADLHACISSKPVILASSFDTLIKRGDWKKLAAFPPVLDHSYSPAFRVAGMPLGLILESYDGEQRRLARFTEINAAPNAYSVSAKWLENAVKAYFKVEGTKWEKRFDDLLFKNVVPFGRRRIRKHERKASASRPSGHFVFAKIMDPVLPIERGRKYEEPLNKALQAHGFGCVVGAGTQTQSNQKNPVSWVALDLELSNLEEALEFTRQELLKLGAPSGSVLEFRKGSQYIIVPII